MPSKANTRKAAQAAATKASKRTPKVPQVPTNAQLRAMPVEELLALRSAMPRAMLKAHYNIRRALRGQGYFISQNR